MSKVFSICNRNGYTSKENCMVFHGMANKRLIFENYNLNYNWDVFSQL